MLFRNIGVMPKEQSVVTFGKRAKIVSFFEEFPFLHRYIPMDAITDVRVSRWDQKLLDAYPRVTWDGEGPYEWNTIFLLNQSHDLVAKIAAPTWKDQAADLFRPLLGQKRKFKDWWVPAHIAITRLADSQVRAVTLAVLVFEDHRERRVVVYKAPNSTLNLKEWMEEIQASQTQVARES